MVSLLWLCRLDGGRGCIRPRTSFGRGRPYRDKIGKIRKKYSRQRHKSEIIVVKYKHLKQALLFKVGSVIIKP